MKKIGVFLLVILFSLQLVASLEIIGIKQEYSQGETLIAKIEGNFVTSITRDNVLFYRSHVRVPMEFSLDRLNDDYYVSAFLPKNSGNYSLAIEGAQYMVGSEISEDNVFANFSILDSIADFSVEPGFLIADKDFVLTVQNLLNTKIVIDYSVLNENTVQDDSAEGGFWDSLFGGDPFIVEGEGNNSLELKSGEKKDINFVLGNISASEIKIIKLASGNFSYEIPIYVLANTGTQINESTPVVIIEDKNETIIETKNETNEAKNNSENIEKTCMQAGGVKCDFDKQDCDKLIKKASDGECCFGKCVDKPKTSYLRIIGWGIIVVIIIFLIWFFKTKYSRVRKATNLMEVALRGSKKSFGGN